MESVKKVAPIFRLLVVSKALDGYWTVGHVVSIALHRRWVTSCCSRCSKSGLQTQAAWRMILVG